MKKHLLFILLAILFQFGCNNSSSEIQNSEEATSQKIEPEHLAPLHQPTSVSLFKTLGNKQGNYLATIYIHSLSSAFLASNPSKKSMVNSFLSHYEKELQDLTNVPNSEPEESTITQTSTTTICTLLVANSGIKGITSMELQDKEISFAEEGIEIQTIQCEVWDSLDDRTVTFENLWANGKPPEDFLLKCIHVAAKTRTDIGPQALLFQMQPAMVLFNIPFSIREKRLLLYIQSAFLEIQATIPVLQVAIPLADLEPYLSKRFLAQ